MYLTVDQRKQYYADLIDYFLKQLNECTRNEDSEGAAYYSRKISDYSEFINQLGA